MPHMPTSKGRAVKTRWDVTSARDPRVEMGQIRDGFCVQTPQNMTESRFCLDHRGLPH